MSPTSAAEQEFATIIGVCEATTLDEAEIRGGRLGWPLAPEEDDWRAGFEKHNGGAVRVVGWRRSSGGGDERLSYWVASGPNAHTACAFSTDRPGLLEALRGRFGAPETLEEQDDIVSASWRQNGRQVSFTRVGTNSIFNLSSRK